MKKIFLLIFLFPLFLFAGEKGAVRGIVLDKKTKEAIPFANIIINGRQIGTTTNIDGFFSLTIPEEQGKINISHISYYPVVVNFSPTVTEFTIYLEPKILDLKEFAVFPSENPAHRIIDSLVAHIPDNSPKTIDAYSCTIYEKLLMTLDTSDYSAYDSIFVNTENKNSALAKMRGIVSKQDLFLNENIIEKTFLAPDKNYHKVTATKVSGIKEPPFLMMLTQLQGNTLYDPVFYIGTAEYLSPISKGTTKRYHFLLQDTTYSESGDTVFLISYQPRKDATFNGLSGVLAINSDGWALQNATAKPHISDTAVSQIEMREMYRKVDGKRWFPYQIHTDFTVRFNFLQESNLIVIKAVGRNYYDNIQIKFPEKPHRLGEVGVTLLPEATRRDSVFWAENRFFPLSKRDENTYRVVDSIGDKGNLDLYLNILESLTRMRIKLWKFDFHLDKILNYQEYQGFYLGLGASTNADFSRIFEFGGYVGYGFKDKTTKYGAYAEVMLYRPRNVKIKILYDYNGMAVGQENFYYVNRSLLSSEYYAQFYINRVDYCKSVGGAFFIDPLLYLQAEAGFYHNARTPSYDYTFVPTGQTSFETTTVELKLRYAFRESRIQMPRSRRPMYDPKYAYPIILLNYTRGIKNLLKGDFDFDRLEFQIQQLIPWKLIGRTQIALHGGMVFGKIPYSLLFVPMGTYTGDQGLYISNVFNAMRRNEFVNDRHLSLFFSHDFKHLFFRVKGKAAKITDPQPQITISIGWGTLQHPEYQSGIAVQDMSRFYFESGLILKKLLFGLDLGCVFRYGAYRQEKAKKNISFLVGYTL